MSFGKTVGCSSGKEFQEAMRVFNWLDTVNLILVFNCYLILAFLVSTGVNIRGYRAVLGLLFAFPNRWPKLLVLVKKHRTIFLGWPTLLVIGLGLALMLANSLAIRLVWVQANVSFEELRGRWLSLAAIILSGGLMLFLDGQAIFSWSFDRAALEEDLDKAESWLKSWMAPAVRLLTFGFINPRHAVGVEVQKALVEANWNMIGGMGRSSLRMGMQLAFGLSLWISWAVALRDSA